MKAFGIESNDTMGIIDRFNEVGNNFAITSAGIGEALQRSASALYAGGNTIDEAIALVTAGNSVIQNPEQVGTALKTLTLRLRGAKVELEEAGLETDNMAETTSQLQAKLKALTHGKVDIMLNDDTFKNTTQILREMSAAWEDMTDIERAAALELMGGKRQANILSSLISNFETVEEVIETSMNSSGSAMAENEKWMDSIAGKSEKLSNNMQTMWENTLNSDAIKFFYDMIIGATDLVKQIGLIGPAIAGALIYLKAFKNIGMISVLQDMGASVKSYAAAMQQVQQVKSLNVGLTAGGLLDANVVNSYAAALSGMTAQQQAAILSSAELEKAQIAQVLAQNGVEDATIRQIVGLQNLNIAKQTSATITAEEAAAMWANNQVKLSDAAATWLVDKATGQLTIEKIKAAVATGALSKETAIEIIAMFNLAGATGTATTGIKGLSAAMGTMMRSNLIGWLLTAIAAITMVASIINTTNQEAIQAAQETISTYQEAQKTMRDQKQTVDELSSSYERLSKGVNTNTNENINLSTGEYEEYLDICNDIADTFPDLVVGWDEQGNAILSLKGNVEQLTQAYKDYASTARQAAIQGSTKVFDFFKKKYNGTDWNMWGGESYGVNDQLRLGNDLLQVLSSGSNSDIENFFANLWGNKNYSTSSLNDLGVMENLLSSAGVKGSDFGYSGLTLGKLVDPTMAKQQTEKIRAYVKSLSVTLNRETNKVKTLMDAYLNEDLVYASYSDTTRSMISTIVSGLDAEFMSGFDSADALYAYIKDNIVDVFQDPEVVNTIDELSDIKLRFSSGEINHGEFEEQTNDLISKIQNKIDPDVLDKIMISIGVEDEELDNAMMHIQKIGDDTARGMAWQLTEEDLRFAAQIEVPEGTLLTWEELLQKIKEVKIGATKDFDLTAYKDSLSSISSSISTYKDALEQLESGSFTMTDFIELIEKFPELAEGVDISSGSFDGLSTNLRRAIKSSPKSLIADLQKLRERLVEAGKSTTGIDQMIESLENMPEDALDGVIDKYNTLTKQIDQARVAQNKLSESMEENPNEGFETRGEAMEYMKEAMKKGEIGSESNLWNVAKQYGFTYDSSKTINENADALAKFIAVREKWFAQDDDGNYTHEGTKSFVEAVESAVKNNAELQQYLTWDYDENTGELNFDFDNANWDVIVEHLSKTKELAGLTSEELSDLIVQVGQYYGINWGDYDDHLDYLNSIADGSESAKTKVTEYGKAMQDAFGGDTTIDLTNRPIVSSAEMKGAGWTDVEDDSYATLYSSTFSSEDGKKSIVVTPILPDGSVLTPDELESYANKILAGEDIDSDINIKLAEFDGANSIQQADAYASALHKAQEKYDPLRDTLNVNNALDKSGIVGLTEISELQDSIIEKADGTIVIDEEAFKGALSGAQYTDDQIDLIIEKIKKLNSAAFNIDPLNINETLLDNGVSGLEEIVEIRDSLTKDDVTGLTVFDTDMFTSVLQEAGYTTEQIDGLIKKIKEYEGIVSVSGNVDPLGLNNADININTLKASLGSLGIAYEDTLGTWFDGKRDLTINVPDIVEALKKKNWTDEAIKDYVNNITNNLNIEGFNVKVRGAEDIDEILEKANNVPDEKQTEYEIIGPGEGTLDGINTKWDEATKPKTTEYTIEETTVRKVEDKTKFNLFDPTTWANGTANAQGTAYSGGSWGAPKTETSLVGELGPEILVRNGRWTTVGENGAEFTQVKRGDIIFNHRQTEELLKNGHVTGRGRAYAAGSGTFSSYGFSGSGGYNKYDVNGNVVESYGDLTGAVDDASDSASDFAETMDWVATRIEEITDDIDLKSAQLDNAVGATAQNKIIDEVIDLKQTLYTNLTAGANKYYSYAKTLLAKIPAEYRAAAQDGSIAITEFAGEVGEDAYNAIEEYREWVQKGDDLTVQAEQTLTDISDLAKQAFDNIAQGYENKTSIVDSKNEKLDAAISLVDEQGNPVSTKYYEQMIKNTKTNISTKQTQRDRMQSTLDDKVKSGEIEKYSDDWYDAVNAIYAVDKEIIEGKKDLESYQNAMNEIYWDNFDEGISRIEYLEDETGNLIDLMGNIKDPVDDAGSWTDEGITAMGLYAQQMEIAEYKSKQYGDAIKKLNKDYKAGKYSESEYLEKLNELKKGQADAIESYYDSKDAIVDLNKTRIDAIKNGIDKEIDAYEELISKKKEELSAEKDLYDFQKSTEKQQKNIADIQRKIAALSGDNSAAAIAKRKQLEAELAEANAELQESYYNRSVEDQQNALDKELENFKDEKEAEKESLDLYLEEIETVIADSLGLVKDNADTVYDTLKSKADEYGLKLDDTVVAPWKSGESAIDSYTSKFGDTASTTTEKLAEMKAEWQKLIAEMDDAAKKEVNRQNTENKKTESATKEKKKTDGGNKNNSGSGSGSGSGSSSKKKSAPSVGSTVKVKTTAKNFGSKSGSAKMASFVPGSSYTVYDVSGGQVLIGKNGVYTGWVNQSDLEGYAKGTLGVSKSQLAMIDELGEELVMHANGSGKLSFLSKGSAVIPHDITENLMALGQLDPSDVLDRSRPSIGINPEVHNTEINLNITYGDMVSIGEYRGDNLTDLEKMVAKQFEKHTKDLNSALRKYAR